MKESDIDFIEEKYSLKRDVIDYGNNMEYDIERVSQSGSEDDNSYSSGFSQEMKIDTRINEEQKDPIEESKEPIIDKLEQRNRDHFLNMFHNQKDFPSAYSIIKSKNLDWSPTKIKKNFKSIKETGDFAPDYRSVRSPIKKLYKKSLIYLTSELSKDNTLSLLEMKRLLLDKFDIKISRTVIGGRLKELGYWYQGPKVKPKVRPKNTDIEKAKRLNWCQRHLNDNWRVFFFTDETTIYLDNPWKNRWIKKGEENIITYKIKEER